MAIIKYFISTSNKNKLANIRVRFYNGKKFDHTARIQKLIMPDNWNNETGKARQRAEFEDYEDFKKSLVKLKNHILNEYNNTPDKTKISRDWLSSTIDKCYNPQKYMQNNTTLFGFIQNFIDNSKTRTNPKTSNPVGYKMRCEYKVTFNYLKEYAREYKEPDFVDIDMEFYQQFTDLLRKEGLAINTIGKKIQTLKIFLNAATEQGINTYQKYKSKSFKAPKDEETDNIYLNKSELQKFYNYDLTDKPRLEKVRDLFIIGCWTGLRYSDLQQITPDKIKGHLIELKQKKTGKKVFIPVHPTVKVILNKYKGILPKAISNQKYNEYLKEAAKLAEIDDIFSKTVSYYGMRIEKKYPKHKLISSHTARRTFCTNAYEDDIPTLAIMAISGHLTEEAFLKYIKTDGKKHAEKVFKKWQESDDCLRIAK